MSSPSNEVSVTVVPTGPMPDAPTNLVATAIGSTVTFAWTGPAGTAASDYRVEAGSAPGLSDLANFATGSTTTSFMATAGFIKESSWGMDPGVGKLSAPRGSRRHTPPACL